MRRRKDGSYGSLFINRKAKLHAAVWLTANEYPTKGFAVREGWHVLRDRYAPHLSKRDRVWVRVQIRFVKTIHRPRNQGGIWYIAKQMRILGEC